MREVIAAVAILAGVALSVTAAVGMVRFPDALTRLHAQTKPAVLGLVLTLAGVALHVAETRFTTVVVLSVALQVLTAPVGSHLVGRAVHRAAGGKSRAGDAARPHKAKPGDPS